jgi:hypothetical protein
MNMYKKIIIGLATLLMCNTVVMADDFSFVRLEANISQTGVLENGEQEFTVSLYKGGTDDLNVVWSQTSTADFTDGSFGVDLGTSQDNLLEPTFFDDSEVYFKITIGQDSVFTPINTVPKAIFADEAGALDWDNLTNVPAIVTQESATLFIDIDNGFVGMGTLTPDTALTVSGDLKIENLSISTLADHTLMSSESGIVKAIDVSGESLRGLRVNSAATGFEFYDIADADVNTATSASASENLVLTADSDGDDIGFIFFRRGTDIVASMNAVGFNTTGELSGDTLVVSSITADTATFSGAVTASDYTGDISGSTAEFSTLVSAQNLHVTDNLTVSSDIEVEGELLLSATGITFSDGSTLLSASSGAIGSLSNLDDTTITSDSDGDGSGGSILFVVGSTTMATINNTQLEVTQAEVATSLVLPGLSEQSEATEVLVRHSDNTIAYKELSEFSLSDAGLISVSENIILENADNLIYITGEDTTDVSPLTLFGRNLIRQSSTENMRLVLGLGATEVSIFGDALLSQGSTADMRAVLELGLDDTPTFAGVSVNGTVSANKLVIVTSTDTLTFPITDGTTGQVLGTDGAGTLDWTTVQAFDDDLDTISDLSNADSNFIVGSASGWVAETGDVVRTSLGLGTADSPLFSGVSVNGTVTANKLMVNVTSAPQEIVSISFDSFVPTFADDLNPDLFISNEIRVGDSPRTGKISFGQQTKITGSGVEDNEVFIRRFDLDSAGQSEDTFEGVLQVHAQDKVFITTGTNNPQDFTDAGGFSPSGVSFNIQSMLDGVYLNDGHEKGDDTNATKNPFVNLDQNLLFDYAVNFIHNSGADDNTQGVMQLSLRGTDIDASTQYIGFTTDKQNLIGAISGHYNDNLGYAQSGIKIESAGADYAEYLERSSAKEEIKKGSIVGVNKGKISKDITGSHRVMVVSSMPLVLGNWKGKGKEHLYEAVAFVGQVPVRVLGTVNAGDYIIPSGKNDGTGIAISKDKLQAKHISQIVGQAWESSKTISEKLINTAITPLDNPSDILESLQAENKELRSELEALKIQVEAIQKSLSK